MRRREKWLNDKCHKVRIFKAFWQWVRNGGSDMAAGVLYPAYGLLLSPIFASAAMAFSSVSVIFNALRLKKTRL